MHESRQTIIISSTGTGTRLERGIPKALLDIDGKLLIIRQLELLRDDANGKQMLNVFFKKEINAGWLMPAELNCWPDTRDYVFVLKEVKQT